METEINCSSWSTLRGTGQLIFITQAKQRYGEASVYALTDHMNSVEYVFWGMTDASEDRTFFRVKE